MDAERLWQGVGAIALAVGAGTAVAPATTLRLYGVDPAQMTGSARLGWRLFAVRNLVLGAAVAAGHHDLRRIAVLVQAPDQLVFLHALRSGSVPRRSALLAMTTSAAVAGLGLAAAARERR